MRTITVPKFIRWAEEHGLTLEESSGLRFRTGIEARFWAIPSTPAMRPDFLASFLELFGDWTSCFVWRHLGSWPYFDEPLNPDDDVEYQILKGLGIPTGTADVFEFTHAESAVLLTLLFSSTIFGCSVADDLYVVPNHARYLLQTDHHHVIHVIFRDSEDVEPWVSQMAERGFPLPDELPDETFKKPPWMPV